MAQTGADPIARFERPLPHPQAVPEVRVRWMREGARLMVRLIALDATLTPREDHSPYVEALGYLQAFGLRCHADNAEIITAAQAEWKAATAYCSRWLEALRRELWGRCRAQQPDKEIIKAADQLCIRWNMPIADDQLAPLVQNIARAAQPFQKQRGKYGRWRR